MHQQPWPKIEDQQWFSKTLREGMTGFLQIGRKFLCLYSQEELVELISDLNANDWIWDIGTVGVPNHNSLMRVPYIVGRLK